MNLLLLIAESTRIGSPVLGVIIPGAVLILSFVVTWMLYKHFSRH